MASEVVDAGRPGSSRARPSRRHPARSDDPPAYDEEELQRLLHARPRGLGVRGRHPQRAQPPGPRPTPGVGPRRTQARLRPRRLADRGRGLRRRRSAQSQPGRPERLSPPDRDSQRHLGKVCHELDVRAFREQDDQRLSAFVAEKVTHTGNTAALVERGGGLAQSCHGRPSPPPSSRSSPPWWRGRGSGSTFPLSRSPEGRWLSAPSSRLQVRRRRPLVAPEV